VLFGVKAACYQS